MLRSSAPLLITLRWKKHAEVVEQNNAIAQQAPALLRTVDDNPRCGAIGRVG